MLFLFVCVGRVTECTHGARGSLNSPIYSSVSLISPALAVPLFHHGPLRIKNLLYASFGNSSRLRGTWTVIPAENNTSFSLVKPSVRPHHREQALRILDIISIARGLFSFPNNTVLDKSRIKNKNNLRVKVCLENKVRQCPSVLDAETIQNDLPKSHICTSEEAGTVV